MFLYYNVLMFHEIVFLYMYNLLEKTSFFSLFTAFCHQKSELQKSIQKYTIGTIGHVLLGGQMVCPCYVPRHNQSNTPGRGNNPGSVPYRERHKFQPLTTPFQYN